MADEAAEEDDAVDVGGELGDCMDDLGPHALGSELRREGLGDAGALRGDGQPLHAVEAGQREAERGGAD
jgi:hypothetical protein